MVPLLASIHLPPDPLLLVQKHTCLQRSLEPGVTFARRGIRLMCPSITKPSLRKGPSSICARSTQIITSPRLLRRCVLLLHRMCTSLSRSRRLSRPRIPSLLRRKSRTSFQCLNTTPPTIPIRLFLGHCRTLFSIRLKTRWTKACWYFGNPWFESNVC